MPDVVLEISCDVEVVRGDSFGWESNVPKAFEVDGHRIRQIDRGGSTMIISGNNVIMGRGNVVIGDVSGGVWVNGKRVDTSSGDDSPTPEIPRLKVTLPDGWGLNVKTSGSSDVRGNAHIGNLHLRTSGSSDIDLDNVLSATISTSGSSDISLGLRSRNLSCSFSGSTKFRLKD